MKFILTVMSLIALVQVAKAAAPNLTDLARNADGSVRYMNQYDADSYCRNQGLRLPTARELALFAQGQGAQGISETPKNGYYLVHGWNGEDHPDNFYYNPGGYQCPSRDCGHILWSSSIAPKDGMESHDEAYLLDDHYGDFVIDNRRNPYFDSDAVRCVLSK